MLKRLIFSILAVILIVATGHGAAFAAAGTRIIAVRTDGGGSQSFSLAGFSGDMKIVPSADGIMSVTATVFPDEKGLGIQTKIAAFRIDKSASDGINVIEFKPFPGTSPESYRLSTKVSVPAGISLALEMQDGSIEIRNVSLGKASIRVLAGSAAIYNSDFVAASISAGKGISIKYCTGAINLSSGEGSITADSHFGAVSANSGSGFVKIRGGLGNRSVVSDSGAVEVSPAKPSTREELELHFYDAIQVNTFSGSVAIKLPAGHYTIDAASRTGRVAWKFARGIKSSETNGGLVIGMGFSAVVAATESGNIAISVGYS